MDVKSSSEWFYRGLSALLICFCALSSCVPLVVRNFKSAVYPWSVQVNTNYLHFLRRSRRTHARSYNRFFIAFYSAIT
jgi:hypothetical protein